MNVEQYDALAPHYGVYARTRSAYCDAVDQAILRRLRRGGGRWLDVGSADGERAVRLAQAAGVPHLVLSDPSAAMSAQCRRREGAAAVWQTAAEHLPAGPPQFDVITCLWNVLGAMDGAAARRVALERLRALLAPGGQIFLDVANRYDVRAGGALPVLARAIRDRVQPSEENGVVRFAWQIDGTRIPARGYLFAESELRALFDLVGLRVVSCLFFDYRTGVGRGPLGGQLFFELEAKRP